MRVLVADDEQDMALALEAMLKRERYSVDVVHTGEDALDWASVGAYDCLVLDIMMPGLDGLGVLKRLRDRKISTPVLLLTAKGDPADRVRGLNEGADDYLPKPFVMEEFLARVRALTRRTGSFVPDALTVGDITLDRSTLMLSAPAGSCRLKNKEHQILELLMRQQGHYVSVDQLIERVWGFDRAIEPNVVWTHISYLRRKLKEVGSTAKITACRGFGYVLEVAE